VAVAFQFDAFQYYKTWAAAGREGGKGTPVGLLGAHRGVLQRLEVGLGAEAEAVAGADAAGAACTLRCAGLAHRRYQQRLQP